MDESGADRVRVPQPVVRSLAALGAVVAFLSVASLISPLSSTARPSGGASQAGGGGGGGVGAAEPSAGDESRVLLLMLTSPRYEVRVFDAGGDEPECDVYDADGNEVALAVPAPELYRVDPMLDFESLMSTAIGEVDVSADDF